MKQKKTEHLFSLNWQPLQPSSLQNSQLFHFCKLVEWHPSTLIHFSHRPVKQGVHWWAYNTCSSCRRRLSLTSIPAEFLWQSLGPRECKREKARPSRAVENTYYGKKIVIPSKSYVSKKERKKEKKNLIFRSLCSANLMGWGHLSWGKWSHHHPQGTLCSRNLSRIPQWMNHSSGKSDPVCTVKKENGTQWI